MNSNEARKILGVTPGATLDEVKKAYRSLAMKHHPDRDGGDEAKFKELQEALSILEKGETHQQSGPFGNSQTVDDLLDDLLREAMARNMHARGYEQAFNQQRILTATIDLTLTEAYNGCIKTVQFSNGPAGLPNTVVVNVKAGVNPNDCLHTVDTGSDIFKVFARFVGTDKIDWGQTDYHKCGNITREINVPVFKMIIGGWFEVTPIDGKPVSVRIPPGLKSNSLLKVKERGYWKNVLCQDRGDLFLRVVPLIQKLDEISDADFNELVNARTAQAAAE